MHNEDEHHQNVNHCLKVTVKSSTKVFQLETYSLKLLEIFVWQGNFIFVKYFLKRPIIILDLYPTYLTVY